MDLFSGSELAFGDSYFNPRTCNVLKVTTELPVKTLVSVEVQKSAGSFSCSVSGLQNRFILWRADGTNLFLDEYSIDRDLIDSTLCINFSQSLIIPGTRLFVVRHKIFLLVVPTQSGIHRFYVHLERNQDDALGNLSLLSRLHQSGELFATHDFHTWRNAGIALKVSVGTDQHGLTKAAVQMVEGTLLRVVYPSLSPMAASAAEEFPLQTSGMLASLFTKQMIETFDILVATDDFGGLRIFSAFRDGKLRCVDASSGNLISCFDLASLAPMCSHESIVDVSLRVVSPYPGDRAEMLLVHLLLSASSHFVLLRQIGQEFSSRLSEPLNDIYIKDFNVQFTNDDQIDSVENTNFCLWVVVDEPTENWESDDILQPYTLKRFRLPSFKDKEGPLNNSVVPIWESVRAASSSSVTDSHLFKYPNSEGIRNRIFDGNNYSFDVVNRAVQVMCKHQHLSIEYGNWIALNRVLDDFLSSGQLKQLYLNDCNEPSDDAELLPDEAKLKQAYEKFWGNFMKTCDQLQEESLEPLAIWQSDTSGLLGVIQKCRFTTFFPPDEQMRTVCTPWNNTARRLFKMIRPNAIHQLNDPEKTSELVNNNTNEICRLISAFGTHALLMTKSPFKLIKFRSHFLNSNFTVALIAMAFRNLVLARLKIAYLINNLVDVIPRILSISLEDRTNPKVAMVISEHNNRIAQSVNYYTTLWIALSVRLVSHDHIPKQINVAQAFLKYGTGDKLVMVQRPSPDADLRENLHRDVEWVEVDEGLEELAPVEEDVEELEEDFECQKDAQNDLEEQIDDDNDEQFVSPDDNASFVSYENSGRLPPPSRWDDTTVRNAREASVKKKRESRFNSFFVDLLDGMLSVLWPESHTLTLPRFLAESNFFDALKNYCALNEPFPPQLVFPFQFLQAIACSGQNKPGVAWEMFQEVSKGVINEEEVLNELLSRMYLSPSVALSQEHEKLRNCIQKPKKKRHSLIEFYNKVMIIFKEHKHIDFVVLAGKQAVNFAKGDGDSLLLSEVYATLFTQHLLSKSYWEAISAVLLNPNERRRSVCLVQLITHLLDTRQTQILIALPYAHLADMVASILESRCKAELVGGGTGGHDSMYNIAYAFHVSRCEYTRAAKLMYELSMRLRQEIQDRSLLQRRCNALATVFQTMQIVEYDDGKNALTWETENVCRDGGEGGNIVDDSQNTVDSDEEMDEDRPRLRNYRVQITREDVARELLKTEARLALMDANPGFVPPLEESDILRESLRHKRYDMAWLLIKEFELKPNDLLEQITNEAIRIDFESSHSSSDERVEHKTIIEMQKQPQKGGGGGGSIEEEEDLPDWVFCNRSFIRDLSIAGNQKPHWRIVISYLDLALKLFPHDSSILRTVANSFLKFSIKFPVWLSQRYSQAHFGDLLRTLIDYGDFEDAFSALLAHIDSTKKRLRESTARQIVFDPMVKIGGPQETLTLLPLAHIETLLQFAEKSELRNQLPVDETIKKLKEFFNYQRVISRNSADA